jgi:hypothetical protein
VATYDLQPQMSAFELTEALVPEERRSRFCLSQLCQRRYGGPYRNYVQQYKRVKLLINVEKVIEVSTKTHKDTDNFFVTVGIYEPINTK